MSELSGIEMLTELLKEVKRLNQKVDVLDRLVKQVANSAKISEIATAALKTPLKNWAQAVTKPVKARAQAVGPPVAKPDAKTGLRFKFESSDAAKSGEAPIRASRTNEPTDCMCEGKMVASANGRTIPLPGVDVSVFDAKDKLVKKTKTNRAGSWMSKLPAGRYVALCEGRFQGKDLYPVNINFEVKPGMRKLEVA